jgi:hypothetical protein
MTVGFNDPGAAGQIRGRGLLQIQFGASEGRFQYQPCGLIFQSAWRLSLRQPFSA